MYDKACILYECIPSARRLTRCVAYTVHLAESTPTVDLRNFLRMRERAVQRPHGRYCVHIALLRVWSYFPRFAVASRKQISPHACLLCCRLKACLHAAGRCRMDIVLLSEVIKEQDLWAYPYNALRNQALARADTDVRLPLLPPDV